MKQKSIPVPAPVKGWWFRDRNGNLFGPYTDSIEIHDILRANRVGLKFETDDNGLPCFDYVLEDWDGLRVDPNELASQQIKVRRNRFKTYHRHEYRNGPVEGIGHGYGYSRYRNAHFGRMIRDTGHGCMEDGEPPIRVKLRYTIKISIWGDYPLRYYQKNWKAYRKHQWHG
ncbi:hypothetical protein [Acidithiobacillus sulfurivorans]|uniref:Uncharacterized protein n=1 Tax=Acidithiobacillus sulfurivorans TaxID=1958756 RepID=A0ABS5ZV17_9PROT|nr:hypothetical protein [Acidithiobacillus sulfurivorans]MBU2759052.1 hypothetical protein [Acidithiobacillus sulfurivorans]